MEDTPESAGPLLDYVEKDIIRIPDPMMHGSQVGLLPTTNWNENLRGEVYETAHKFHENIQRNPIK